MAKHNDANLVRAAEMRTRIKAFLLQKRRPMNSGEILAALEPAYTELGLTKEGAAYHLRALAQAGEISSEQKQPRGAILYAPLGNGLPEPAEAKTPHEEPSKRSAAGKDADVELVVAGVTIIVGRNPATGRPRIIIEG